MVKMTLTGILRREIHPRKRFRNPNQTHRAMAISLPEPIEPSTINDRMASKALSLPEENHKDDEP
jgi:hypothetical protein